MCVLGWYEPRKKTHTFTGCSRHFKLVHEAPELLSYSHSSQQTLVVEKMLLTPLGALLVLPERSKNTRSELTLLQALAKFVVTV